MEGGKQRIQENMDELVNKIDCCPLFPFFRLKKIFSQRSVNEIQQYSDKRRRNFEVLTNVYRRSASVFNSFVDVLWMSGQRDAARILKPEESTRCLLPSTSMSSYTFSPRVNGDNYKMTSKPRGYCVIINNRDFEEEDEIRKMSELDAKYLTNAFAYLGFDVRLHSNLTHTEMKDVLDDYSQRDDLKNHDAIVVIIMTHGNEKHLRAIDGGYLTEDEITSPFAADNCPALNRKPKMFFIQACRGEKDDEGVLRLPDSDDDDNSRFVHTTEVCDAQPFSVTNSTGRRRSSSLYDPSHGDMLISYATVSGYRAYRTVDADHPSYLGSWYVKALHCNLVQYAHEKKLRDILDNVYRDVSEMETEDGYKQAPTYENRGFHKNLYFNPGYYE